MIVETVTSGEVALRKELRIWEPPVLDDLGSTDLVAGSVGPDFDGFSSALS